MPIEPLAAVRTRRPKVHVIIGGVTTAFVTDVLAAIGAAPTVTHDAPEAAHMAATADALLVNLAQSDEARRKGAQAAAQAARKAGVPWLFDPAMIHRSPPRLIFARRLMALGPTIIKPNRSELAALTGAATEQAAGLLAIQAGGVVFLTGPKAVVTDGREVIHALGSHPQLAAGVGYGCALGAVATAFLAVLPPMQATITAHRLFLRAAERAGVRGRGPASFRIAFIDSLHELGEGP